MKRFPTTDKLVSIRNIVDFTPPPSLNSQHPGSVKSQASPGPSQPTLAHPVIRTPNYHHTAPLVLPRCLCQVTVQHKDMCKQLRWWYRPIRGDKAMSRFKASWSEFLLPSRAVKSRYLLSPSHKTHSTSNSSLLWVSNCINGCDAVSHISLQLLQWGYINDHSVGMRSALPWPDVVCLRVT